jgi:hypothetical protein
MSLFQILQTGSTGKAQVSTLEHSYKGNAMHLPLQMPQCAYH